MPYPRALGAIDVNAIANADAPYDSGDNGDGIDWTQVITTGEQVIGTVINHGTPIPTRYPTYIPSSTLGGAISSPVVLLAGLGAVLLLLKAKH